MKKLIAILLVLFVLLSSASATSIQVQTEEEYIRKEFEANLQYTALLNSFSSVDGTISYPDYYGGAYLNADGNLVVNVTELTDDIELAVKTATGNRNILIDTVDYSYSYLLGLQTQLIDYIQNNQHSEIVDKIVSTAVLSNGNNMKIGVTDQNSTTISTIFSEIFGVSNASNRSRSVDLPLFFVVEERSELFSSTTKSSEAQPANASSFYAGNKISTSSNTDLSVGFPAYGYSQSKGKFVPGFVTAAHGCSLGDTIYDTDGTIIGTVLLHRLAGSVDAAFVEIVNSNYSLPTVIEAYLTGNSTPFYWGAPLTYSVTVAEGSTIYRDGYMTGCVAGEVYSVAASETYEISENEYVTISDLIQTDSPTSYYGDSGGIAFILDANDVAYKVGITEGGNVLEGDYYVKCSNITNHLGLVYSIP